MLSHVKFIDCTYDIYSNGHYLKTHSRLEGLKKLGGQRFLPVIAHLLHLFLQGGLSREFHQKPIYFVQNIQSKPILIKRSWSVPIQQ